MKSDYEFEKNKQIGDQGEIWTFGYLECYCKFTNQSIKNVQHYFGEGVYRWQNKRLPDFLLMSPEGKGTFVEVKCKEGVGEYLNISCSHIHDYEWCAKQKGYDLFILFFCLKDLCVYKLTQSDFRKYADVSSPIENPRDRYFLYEKDNLEKWSSSLPSSLFNNDILHK